MKLTAPKDLLLLGTETDLAVSSSASVGGRGKLKEKSWVGGGAKFCLKEKERNAQLQIFYK